MFIDFYRNTEPRSRPQKLLLLDGVLLRSRVYASSSIRDRHLKDIFTALKKLQIAQQVINMEA